MYSLSPVKLELYSGFKTLKVSISPANHDDGKLPGIVKLVLLAAAGNVSKNYKFDQLGEYRVLTSGLSGDQSSHAKFEVEFQDGAYGITTAGPCKE